MKQNKFDKNYYFGEVYENYDNFLDFKKIAKDLITRYSFKSFLDVGCGCGNLVKEIKKQLENKYYKSYDVQGVDISQFAVNRARVPFVYLVNCINLPFENEHFDLVYILGTFSYLTFSDTKRAIKEAYRVCRKMIVFEDVYTIPDKSSDNYDPHRLYILGQKQWRNLWEKNIDKNNRIKTYKEEIIIEKNET